MAKAKKLPSGRWRVQIYDYTDSSGKIIRKSFTADTKKQAEFLAMDYKVNKPTEDRTNLTIAEAMQNYIENRKNTLAPSTVREYTRTIRRAPVSLLCLQIDFLKNEQVQKEFDLYAVNHSPKTCRNLYGLITASLKAVKPQFVLNIKLPQKKPPKINIPNHEDIKKILEYTKNTEMELPVLLGAMAGLRRSEIAALTYEDFDFKNKTITINKAMVLNNKNEWITKQPKTAAGNRKIQVSESIIDVAKKRQAAALPLITLKPSHITDRFADVLKRADVPHFRFHDLRHYNASVMLALGIPDKYAISRMGHSTTNMLQNVYQHLIDEKQKEVNNQINNFFNSF